MASPVTQDRRRRVAAITGHRLAPGALAATASLALALLALEIWHADLRVPMTLGSEDAVSVLLYMKTTIQHAWPLHNPLLGAPFGQDLQDYPLGDPVQILLTKGIAIFTGDVALVTNLFFLLTFPLAAIAALWALRRLDAPLWPAVACAVIYALAPYHFLRGEDHLLIAAYYTVPLSCFLVVRQLADDMPSVRTTVVLSVLIGAAFTYYLVFTLILLGFAVLLSLAARRRTAAVRGGIALGVIAVVAFAAHIPTWAYHLEHGGNPTVDALRGADQTERFGLRLTRLLLPVEGHRVGPLADLTARAHERPLSQLQEGPAQALGVVAAVGFVWLLWVAASQLVRPLGRSAPGYVRASALAAVATCLLGLSGGASGLIASLGSPLIRSWSRLSIFIAFFGLVAAAHLLGRATGALAARSISRPVIAVVVGAVVVLAALDQTTPGMVPAYARLSAQWESDEALAEQLAARLPAGAMVFQLPYSPYPEWSYESARPSLHTDDLRFTFGAMAGRPQDWTAALAPREVDFAVDAAAVAGADAVYVDKHQYPDGGGEIERDLRRVLGDPMLVSSSGKELVFDLRRRAATLRDRLGQERFADVRRRTLHPVLVQPGTELSPPQGSPASLVRNRVSFGPDAELNLVNPLPGPRAVRVRIPIGALTTPSEFLIRRPDGRSQAFVASPSATAVGELTLAEGDNVIRITDLTDPPPFSNIWFSITEPVVEDVEVDAALGSG